MLHGMNRFSFSIIPSSFISFLFSPKIDNFFKKFRTMKSRSGLFRSSMDIKRVMICLFFILRSIWRSSARLSSKWNATKRTFSYFLIIMASFFLSLTSSSEAYSYCSDPFISSNFIAFCLYSRTLTTYLLISWSMILIVVSPI